MFVGEYTGKLDVKGRVIFPMNLKKQLPEGEQQFPMVIKKDIYEKCLILYSKTEWEFQTATLKKKLNPFDRRHAEFLREYYRGTAELSFDANNRLLIPRKLLDLISADKDIVFAGQKGKIEIWSQNEYDSRQMSQEDFADMANDILGGDFGFYNEV